MQRHHAGGAYRLAPAADPADRYLDVCLVRRVPLPRFLMAIPRVMRGTHADTKEVALFWTRDVTLRAPETPLPHLDGELCAPDVLECTVIVAPGRRNVLVSG